MTHPPSADRVRALAVLLCLCLCTAPDVAADSGTLPPAQFGIVQNASTSNAILWQDPSQVELTPQTLRFTRPGATLRSEQLPLKPLQRYRISATMARGPGSTPRFAITYRDAGGKPSEWTPAWQHKNAPHANWLPLSPHTQRYVQTFVLPQGASQPRLVLRLDASHEKVLARYDHWTLNDLRFESAGPVTCCKRLGDNLLWNGDFEQSSEPLKQWSQAGTQLELIHLEDVAFKRVLRVRPGTSAQLFSRYNAPVVSGRAYRLSLKARGQGRVELDVHSLTRDTPVPLRVGNHTSDAGQFDVHTSAWQEVSTVWFAEAPNVTLANVVIAVTAQAEMELDAIELRPFE
jgi:hypothetical protein